MRISVACAVNICFHGIGRPVREREAGENRYWISQSFFERILDLAVDRPYVNISFDDGNQSDLRIGLPALLDREMTADFYLIAGRLDDVDSLDRTDAQELVAAGMTIGSHGMNHRSWRALPAVALAEELDIARRVLAETTEMVIDRAALPLGSYDRQVLRNIRRRNYTRVMTSDRAYASPKSWMQPRFSIRADDTIESVANILQPPRLTARHLRARARIFAKSLR